VGNGERATKAYRSTLPTPPCSTPVAGVRIYPSCGVMLLELMSCAMGLCGE
jgi:hypothetical protein